MIKAVLFDLDGTFADTAPDLGAALNHVLALHGKPPLPPESIRPQASHGSAGLLGLAFGITPEDPGFDALRLEFLAHYTANICVHTTLFAGMTELVSAIEQRGLPWGIVTNKPHRFTVMLMQALGYAERAACLVSGDTCAHAKPHPLPMLHAARAIGVTPEHCLYLGDDKRDMEAANAANMRGIIARYGYIDPQAELSTWRAAGAVRTPLELLRYMEA
ncbi:MAG: HAD family hydrolase [Gallionellaceae bacterium]|nr:MAG: HAD family hydrolase [Gallionellaceae bacterium]